MARLPLAAHLTDGETEDERTSWQLGEDLGVTSALIGLQRPLLGDQGGKGHGFQASVSKGRGSGSGEGTPPTLMCRGMELRQDVKQLELEEQLGP